MRASASPMELERQKAAHAAFLKEWEELSESLQDAV